MYKESELRNIFNGKRILIAGFGREGRSSYLLIRKLFPYQSTDITLAIADKNTAIETDAMLAADHDIAIFSGDNYLKHAGEYDVILKSPGIPTFDFDGIAPAEKISSQTDIFLQLYADQTIGITGTKGKSTTTNLIYSMMKMVNPNTIMAGNMGLPLFDSIENIDSKTLLVLELSSHQLENIHRSPHIGILLNLFQEHLDHYNSYLDYRMAKLNIGLHQSKNDVFIYCKDNDELDTLVQKNEIKSIVLPYSMSRKLPFGCYLDGDDFKLMPTETVIYNTGSKRYLRGTHNLSNCMAVFLVGHCYGIADDVIATAIANFKGLEHRLEYVTTTSYITFYNDSISTIPEATIAAVEALKNVDTLILGGFDRGIDYTALATFIAQSTIANIAFVGNAGQRIYNLLGSTGYNKNYLLSNNYPEVVNWCFQHTAKGKICLLSPAASSYDMFKNFEERGRVFKQLITDKA
jgi:UDP-N-acetylmuramoylalanine--D-glutamate ligase